MVAVRIVAGRHDLAAVAAASPGRYPGLLESVAAGTPQARWDILFAFPEDSLRLDADGRVRDGQGRALGESFLGALDRAWAEQGGRTGIDDGWPFHGGWLLYLGYEFAGEVEPRLRPWLAPGRLPSALALRCPAAILFDHREGHVVLLAEAGREDLIASMAEDLATCAPLDRIEPRVLAVDEDAPARFLDGVARTHAYLQAGDVFQVNLSREWRVTLAPGVRPVDIHAALRRANPAPFAGLLQVDGFAVASSSPERLVEVRGREVQTRPIAGTRPRLPGDDIDARIRELVGHPKERAEHVMLIDLERNDLGRVCEPGSVVVDELMAVESYAHVHHIVSNVRGRLRAAVTPGDVMRAVFPGGTITGCPKVRCMEIIAELEQAPRGAYTGSLGYLDRNGDLDLNILIRTVVQVGDSASFRAGAGIVVDSDAAAELAETRAKARGLLRALGIDG